MSFVLSREGQRLAGDEIPLAEELSRAASPSTGGEAETIGLGFLEEITGKRGLLAIGGFGGVLIFANGSVGSETLRTVDMGTARTKAERLGRRRSSTNFQSDAALSQRSLRTMASVD